METNLRMVRISAKMDELFTGKIDLSDISNPDNYTSFYTRAIAALTICMNCGVEEDIAAQCVTDGYHDIGIDAIYNDAVQKKLILVQSKWRKDGLGAISQDEVNNFIQGVERIINLDINGCNDKILRKQEDITSAIRDMDYQIEMIFCHTGNQSIPDYASRSINGLLKKVNDDDTNEMLIFTEVKINDIYDYLANGHNLDSISLNDVLLHDWGIINTPYKSYYGAISVSAVGEWYQQFGNRLFDKNIRYYKGSTEVNQGIKEVLRSEPDRFFYYNNGLKILCRKITRKIERSTTRETGLFALEGVSLVNGAQTTGAIGSVFAEAPEDIVTARVLVQIIEIGDSNEGQAVQITKLSNTQNRIEGKDFASLDPQQERLRVDLSISGIQYLYKSGAKVDNPDQQITLDEAIISQACLLTDLSIVALTKRNVGALTENIERAPYKLLFNGSTNSFSLYNGVLVLRAVERCLKRNEGRFSGRKRLVLVHGNRFILHMILQEMIKIPGFDNKLFSSQYIEQEVEIKCEPVWEKVYAAMEKKLADAYPAHIYKNVGRLRVIAEELALQ